jgi:hypothetical protein
MVALQDHQGGNKGIHSLQRYWMPLYKLTRTSSGFRKQQDIECTSLWRAIPHHPELLHTLPVRKNCKPYRSHSADARRRVAVEQIRHSGGDNLQARRDKQMQVKAHLG